MADIEPVGAMIRPPQGMDPLATLNGILGLRQRQQALETGQYLQQSAKSQATIDQQSAKENQALAGLLQDPVGAGIVDSDGNPTAKAQSIIMSAAPTTGSQHVSGIINAAKQKVDFNVAKNSLRQSERQEIGQAVAGVAANPNANFDDVAGQVQQLVESKKGTPEYDTYKTIAGTLLQGAQHVRDKTKAQDGGDQSWRQFMVNGVRGFLSPAELSGPGGLATPTKTVVDQGATLQPGTTAPALQGGGFVPGGAAIVKSTPPAIATTPAGIVRVAPGGQSASVVPSANTNADGTPANPSQAQTAVRTATAEGISTRVQHAQAAANNTVQSQDALSRALEILRAPDAPLTGKLAGRSADLKNLMSSIGIDTSGADNLNSLVKNLARYEASRATQAGLGGTDAARELAHNGSPHVNLDNKALRGIVMQSLATEKALATYANVQAKAPDEQTMIKNETAFRSIPHLIEGYQYRLAKTPEEAEEVLKRSGLSKSQMLNVYRQISQFESNQ